jgi:hypothetical protein
MSHGVQYSAQIASLKRQPRPNERPRLQIFVTKKGLTLTRLEARVGLVDDVNPTLAAHQLIVAVALDQGLERIADFHNFT